MLTDSFTLLLFYSIDIVACQRGGLSKELPWDPGSDNTRGQGSLKRKRAVHLTRFLLRQGEPGTSQYNILYNYDIHILLISVFSVFFSMV